MGALVRGIWETTVLYWHLYRLDTLQHWSHRLEFDEYHHRLTFLCGCFWCFAARQLWWSRCRHVQLSRTRRRHCCLVRLCIYRPSGEFKM